jgi:hypothetical protein
MHSRLLLLLLLLHGLQLRQDCTLLLNFLLHFLKRSSIISKAAEAEAANITR